MRAMSQEIVGEAGYVRSPKCPRSYVVTGGGA